MQKRQILHRTLHRSSEKSGGGDGSSSLGQSHIVYYPLINAHNAREGN